MPDFAFDVTIPRTRERIAGCIVGVVTADASKRETRTGHRPFTQLHRIIIQVLLKCICPSGEERIVERLILVVEVGRRRKLRIKRTKGGFHPITRISFAQRTVILCCNRIGVLQCDTTKFAENL